MYTSVHEDEERDYVPLPVPLTLAWETRSLRE